MNKRMYDHALEVLKDYPTIDSWTFSRLELEQFAQLIVNDCAKCVEHINMQGGGNLGDVIKNKFGVEQ
jgi:hypothetical protein